MARPAISQPRLCAVSPIVAPSATTTIPARIVGRRPNRSETGPPDQDAERERDERDGKRGLHCRDVGDEIGAYGRQGREVHVGRDRSQRDDRGQQENECPVAQPSMPPMHKYLSSV
jgi:hypothetical protein